LHVKFLNINDCFNNQNSHPSPLSGLLHSIYMNELDTFVQKLKKKLTLNTDELSLKNNKNYNLIMCSFGKNPLLKDFNKNRLTSTELKIKKNKTKY
jgi:hypothetical protein